MNINPPWHKAAPWANFATRDHWGLWTFWAIKPELVRSPITNHPKWMGRGRSHSIGEVGKKYDQYENQDWWERVEVRP